MQRLKRLIKKASEEISSIDQTKMAMSMKDYIEENIDTHAFAYYAHLNNINLNSYANDPFKAVNLAIEVFANDENNLEEFWLSFGPDWGITKDFKEVEDYLKNFALRKLSNYCNIDDISTKIVRVIREAKDL